MSQTDLPSAEQFERLIRASGAVIDPPLVKSLYAPLRDGQPRDGAEVRHDIAYGDDERNKLDVYLPTPGDTKNRPLLLFVHGGGFVCGDRRERANVQLEKLARARLC